MQAKKEISPKQILLNALAEVMRELRAEKSQFLISSENDISLSIISMTERGLKDPQFTTIFRLAEAYNINIIEFVERIYKKLPDNFELIDK